MFRVIRGVQILESYIRVMKILFKSGIKNFLGNFGTYYTGNVWRGRERCEL